MDLLDAVELSSIVLKYIINYAKLNGENVKDVVVTCPAYFGDAQRDAIVRAASMAGLNVMAIVNDPVAAAILYYNDRCDIDQKALVVDLGGKTFDVTLIRATQSSAELNIQTLATYGVDSFGGYDWDEILYELLLDKYEEEYGIPADDELRAIIRSKSEKTKMRLTFKENARFRTVYEGEMIALEVSRKEFEYAAAHLVDYAISRIDEIFNKAERSGEEVDLVLVIGGATQMPMIRNSLINRFGKKIVFGNPKSTVLGAALVADMIQRNTEQPDSLTGSIALTIDQFKKRSEWDTEQIFDKLRVKMQQGIAHFVYSPLTDHIEISYENDSGDKELLDIFQEIRIRKEMYLKERQQIEKICRDSERLLCDRKRLNQLRVKLKKMEENGKHIEELIKNRLWENMTELFLQENSMEELGRRLDEHIANQEEIKKIVDVLAQETDKFIL